MKPVAYMLVTPLGTSLRRADEMTPAALLFLWNDEAAWKPLVTKADADAAIERAVRVALLYQAARGLSSVTDKDVADVLARLKEEQA